MYFFRKHLVIVQNVLKDSRNSYNNVIIPLGNWMHVILQNYIINIPIVLEKIEINQ